MILVRCSLFVKSTSIKDDGRCPGAFHVGCQEDQTEAPTEEPTTTIPESQCTLAKTLLENVARENSCLLEMNAKR